MSYYDNSQWQAAGQAGWDQQTPPARSGASSVAPREEATAFSSQLEEVDRAIENLFKSGKIFNMPVRRESMPMGGPGRVYPDFDPRMSGPASSRHHSVTDFGGDARNYSASNLQNFYATQRHQPSRANDAEQMLQAKRRMAAQRERELRNYHQEQQYNRTEITPFGGKPDRTMSPGSGMSEEERRELIARQRSALYGEGSPYPDSAGFVDENGNSRSTAQGPGNQLGGGRGHSPLNGGSAEQAQGQQGVQAQGQQQRSRANSTSSPSSNNPASFSLFDNAAQQSSRTSNSSPTGGSPPRQGGKAGTGSSVAPIGTRPGAGQQAANPALNKRSTTPLPSPLSYGYAPGEENNGNNGNADRATSAASNPSSGQDVSLGWGSKSGVWGKNSLGVQASVWG